MYIRNERLLMDTLRLHGLEILPKVLACSYTSPSSPPLHPLVWQLHIAHCTHRHSAARLISFHFVTYIHTSLTLVYSTCCCSVCTVPLTLPLPLGPLRLSPSAPLISCIHSMCFLLYYDPPACVSSPQCFSDSDSVFRSAFTSRTVCPRPVPVTIVFCVVSDVLELVQ